MGVTCSTHDRIKKCMQIWPENWMIENVTLRYSFRRCGLDSLVEGGDQWRTVQFPQKTGKSSSCYATGNFSTTLSHVQLCGSTNYFYFGRQRIESSEWEWAASGHFLCKKERRVGPGWTSCNVQLVPRSKHFSIIKTSQLMLYREIIAAFSQIRTEHINTLCGQNVDLLNVKLTVHTVTTGLIIGKLTLAIP